MSQLHKTTQKIIAHYQNLDLGGKKVCTPYYINTSRSKDLRVMVGKGTPEEIEMEARIWEKVKGVDFSLMSNLEIKQFLTGRGIGIDCSGFIVHVLNVYYQEVFKKPLWKCLKIPVKTVFSKLKYFLRPIEHLGA